MIKNSKNLIKNVLLFIAVLALGTIMPNMVQAQYDGYVNAYNTTRMNSVNSNVNGYNSYSSYNGYNNNNGQVYNPAPRIYSISPNSVNKNLGSMRIVVSGDGFVPGSVIRLDGIDQITTYINPSRVEMQFNDLARTNIGNSIILVYNSAPGGGYSNDATLNINNGTIGVSSANTTKAKTTSNSPTITESVKNTIGSPTGEVLGASAIFGGTNFMPSNLVQWLIFFIFIFLIIYLTRKIYTNDQHKHIPLKHA